MNGSKSPDLARPGTGASGTPSGGHLDSTKQEQSHDSNEASAGASRAKEDSKINGNTSATHGADEDAASEAETLISTPVKKREAAKQNAVVKVEKPLRSRIGGLPVPGEDDEDSVASPMPSTEVSVGKAHSSEDAQGEDVEMLGGDDDPDNGSDLSSVRSEFSRASSRSRAVSEMPNTRRGDSPNPRKRKYRASSVGLLQNKRQSTEPPRTSRKLRATQADDTRQSTERSPTPKLRSHKRTVSTHSAVDGGFDGAMRTRRSGGQASARESKATKTDSAESDVSSETTSRAGDDVKRSARHIGRSTSTPGRPAQREHKRHVNKYGFTRLAEACENDDLKAVKEWRVKDPDSLELAEFAGNKPLQIAALKGNADVVAYLIKEGCQIGCANLDKDTPLIDAAENGHLEVVKLLLDAGVDPLRHNMKGQQALDVVTNDVDDAKDIRIALREAIDRWNSDDARQRREEEEVQRHSARGGPSRELHFMARTYENLLKLVTNMNLEGVQEFLDARVPVDNLIIAAAAKTGDSYLLNMLLAEMQKRKLYQKAEKPMLAVLGSGHFEMVKLLTELEQFDPLWTSRQGKTWPEIAEERNGPMWRQERELLQRLYDQHASGKARRSSSPVSKRDANGKRRMAHRQVSADSGEDDEERSSAPKRKNGRRLMSRKDMRAASGKGASDSSEEEEDSSDNDPPNKAAKRSREDGEGAMPPPSDAPTSKRGTGRTRSKSTSSQPSEASPRTRRHSISLRGDRGLPTVEENREGLKRKSARAEAENKDEQKGSENAKSRHAARQKPTEEGEIQVRHRKSPEASRKAEEERLAEERRKAEEQQRAEDERKAEEARVAAEARQREEAEAAEAARKAEEERVRKEQELEIARQKLRSDVLDGLPQVLQDVLGPTSSFIFDEAGSTAVDAAKSAEFLLRTFTPLRPLTLPHEQDGEWILNLQAAPLLGKQGIELFFADDCICYADSLASRLPSLPFTPAHRTIMKQLLTDFPLSASLVDEAVPAPLGPNDVNGRAELFLQLLRDNEARESAFDDVVARLTNPSSSAVLRCVRFKDVIQYLDPLLRARNIKISGFKGPKRSSAATESNDKAAVKGEAGSKKYFDRLRTSLERNRPPRVVKRVLDGSVETVSQGQSEVTRMVDVVVVHEK